MKLGMCVGCLLVFNWLTVLFAESAVGWRTDGTGVYPDAHPPTKWSKQENVAWATPLASRSNAQPVPVGDKILVCAEPLTLLCLRATDGKILWKRTNSYRDVTTPKQWSAVEKELAIADPLRTARKGLDAEIETLRKADREGTEQAIETLRARIEDLDRKLQPLELAAKFTLPVTQPQFNGYTTSTPTTDGKHVWAVFGNRVVVCYDLQGKRRWASVLPDNPQSMWGHSSSPLLVDGTLVVNIEHTVAFDALTGRQLWRTKYGQAWGSSVRARIGKGNLILLANGRMLRATDGKVLARAAPLGNASPVVDGGSAYYVGVRAAAFDLPKQLDDVFELKQSWESNPKGGQFFASPVVHNGLVYAVSTQHVLTVIDAKSGEIVYVRRLDLGKEPVWASLCIAGRYLYVSSRDGTTLVLKTGREYQEVNRNQLAYFISTPVFDGDRMYVRTSDHLYCIRGS